MKWRNLISYRDRLYTSNANIDVFELWTIWFVITKWKLEMGMSADCGDHVQICAIIALYIFPASSMMNASFPFSFYRFFFIVTPRTREYESSDRLLFIVSLHFSLRRPSLIFENASLRTDYSYRFFTFFIPFNVIFNNSNSFRCTYSDTFFQNPRKSGFNMVWTISKHVSPWFLPC